MLLDILFIVLGITFTIIGANFLVDGSVAIARKAGISDLVIGLTIVALGTSSPELVVSVYSAIQGISDISIGNITGSNIANILLILGATAIIYPLRIHDNTKRKDIPFSFIAILCLTILVNDHFFDASSQNILSRGDGIILLLFLLIFINYTFESTKKQASDIKVDVPITHMPIFKSILFVIIGIIGLFAGGRLLVNGAVSIAQLFGISDRVIGLTIIAIGTSIPELVTSVIAAIKRNTDIAIGNVIGSNIINILLILGVTATIHPLSFNIQGNIDIAVGALATILLYIFIFTPKINTIGKKEGIIFLILYAMYIFYLIKS